MKSSSVAQTNKLSVPTFQFHGNVEDGTLAKNSITSAVTDLMTLEYNPCIDKVTLEFVIVTQMARTKYVIPL